MRIITISREFGSGGRELGKRLADLMKIDGNMGNKYTILHGKMGKGVLYPFRFD